MDQALFHWINSGWANPVFDWIAPRLSWNRYFPAAVLVLGAALLWRNWKGRLFVPLLASAILFVDAGICGPLKKEIGRRRPFLDHPEARLLVGKTSSGSMPSSHAANWFAAAAVTFLFYRRARWAVLALAAAVAWSRIYVGVHYPSDVVAGAAIGWTAAWAWLALLDAAWRVVGRKWFPLWHARIPSLQRPELQPAAPSASGTRELQGAQWRRFAWIAIGGWLAFSWWFVAFGPLQLSEDEAYQWLWSKHLDWSYYSKPPLIAYAQFLATRVWGDTVFGVRFFAPLLSALTGAIVFRWMEQARGARLGARAVWGLLAMPLLQVGATLMSIDALSVFFWTAAMAAGWNAIQHDRQRWWAATGLALGFGFLAKYVAVAQLISFGLFFAASPSARSCLRRRGPWLALALLLVSLVPVVYWNARHGWITVESLLSRGGFDLPWRRSLNFFRDFWLAEFGLLNPIFFLAMLWAAAIVWKRRRRDPLSIYLWCMGAPLFIGYGLLALRSRTQPNWVAPGVIPLFLLALVTIEDSASFASGIRRQWYCAGLVLGLAAALLLHDRRLALKVAGGQWPGGKDPFARLMGWQETADIVAQDWRRLQSQTRAPAFILADHYGLTSLLTFYIPEARRQALREPIVFFPRTPHPENQFYFWKGPQDRVGQNALYVAGHLGADDFPEKLRGQFSRIDDLGIQAVRSKGETWRRIHLYAFWKYRGDQPRRR